VPGDVTQRFSSRVDNYIRYRPGYPDAILDTLRDAYGLTPASIVADVGSGTGILTEMFLRHGNVVYGIEPNREMREAAERLLAGYDRFHSVAATAEDTTLGDDSVDLVTAGQAFHWFDPSKARAEFARVLKPGGWVALIWNERVVTTPFLADYAATSKFSSLDGGAADVD
jgi:ubiquinone/menaquinone biosynthesis C-methylase UbiE